MAQTSSVTYTKQGHYGLIRIEASDREMTSRMSGLVIDACTEIAWDEDVRVVGLMTDGDLLLPTEERVDTVEGGAAAVEAIARLTVPVLAAIRGDGTGFGLELSLACDIRVGAEGCRFGFPDIQDGTIPCSGGTQRLPRLVGRGRALDMVLTGETVGSDDAVRIGLINRVFPSDLLEQSAVDLVAALADKSPLAMRYVKEALHGSQDLTLDQGLRLELDLYLLLFTTQDRTEGVTAFQKKRAPNFTGE
jgi:enoyl-CoA hydratase